MGGCGEPLQLSPPGGPQRKRADVSRRRSWAGYKWRIGGELSPSGEVLIRAAVRGQLPDERRTGRATGRPVWGEAAVRRALSKGSSVLKTEPGRARVKCPINRTSHRKRNHVPQHHTIRGRRAEGGDGVAVTSRRAEASQAKRGQHGKKKGVFHVKHSYEEEIKEGYRILPEAKPQFDFESLWGAFWRSCEYCGSRATLRTIVGHMGKQAQFEVYRALIEETEGSWPYELEIDDEGERDEYAEAAKDVASSAEHLIRAARAILELEGGSGTK